MISKEIVAKPVSRPLRENKYFLFFQWWIQYQYSKHSRLQVMQSSFGCYICISLFNNAKLILKPIWIVIWSLGNQINFKSGCCMTSHFHPYTRTQVHSHTLSQCLCCHCNSSNVSVFQLPDGTNNCTMDSDCKKGQYKRTGNGKTQTETTESFQETPACSRKK